MKKTFLVLCLGLALLVVAAWIQSYHGGWREEWDSEGDVKARDTWRDPGGGRAVSERGLFYVQSVGLGADERMHDLIAHMNWAGAPKGFCVGSNPDGERARLVLNSNCILELARPDQGDFIRYQSSCSMNSSTTDGWWAYRWKEYVVAYWLLLALFLFYPAATAIRWLVRRRRSATPSPQ